MKMGKYLKNKYLNTGRISEDWKPALSFSAEPVISQLSNKQPIHQPEMKRRTNR
jgi:hypothetical protein